ncbi:ATP/GTP binding protein [Planococcus halocryophilus Or1]|uniref:ATP/GTP-binding protein n=1 Tax=Planococcus halocryophilus TaxID=1215089 RepID=UPI0002B875F1|nr:ATP/GTP-binding protein [Planococcus halocryophilus]EMF46968.1 ATP/GTP binding protein [Planococcus halocryophilus Or1]
MEAFATFNYNLGIEGLTANEKVLDLLTTEKEKAYFKNRMYRLVLNSESHLYERTRGILTRGFAENFSVDEKVKTAKDIIILMHSLNPTHIDILLSNKNDSDQTLEEKLKLINSWRNEIFSSITR